MGLSKGNRLKGVSPYTVQDRGYGREGQGRGYGETRERAHPQPDGGYGDHDVRDSSGPQGSDSHWIEWE